MVYNLVNGTFYIAVGNCSTFLGTPEYTVRYILFAVGKGGTIVLPFSESQSVCQRQFPGKSQLECGILTCARIKVLTLLGNVVL